MGSGGRLEPPSQAADWDGSDAVESGFVGPFSSDLLDDSMARPVVSCDVMAPALRYERERRR